MKLLITGAGGAAAVSFFKSISYLDLEVFMADIEPYAVGLYLVSKDHRCIIEKGSSKNFASSLLDVCLEKNIDVVIPTVDAELVALAKYKSSFDKRGIKIPIAPVHTLQTCLDKYALMKALDGIIPLAQYCLYNDKTCLANWRYPFIAKPRTGSGSRGIKLIKREQDLSDLPKDDSYILQENLPGTEYSVDTYVNNNGFVVSAVIRARLKTYSGVAVASCTLKDKELSLLAEKVAKNLNLRFVSNIQFKRDIYGNPKLLEINPRFPGTMPLTVGAGVNMPELCLRDLQDKLPNTKMDYDEIAVVRFWAEQFVCIDEFASV